MELNYWQSFKLEDISCALTWREMCWDRSTYPRLDILEGILLWFLTQICEGNWLVFFFYCTVILWQHIVVGLIMIYKFGTWPDILLRVKFFFLFYWNIEFIVWNFYDFNYLSLYLSAGVQFRLKCQVILSIIFYLDIFITFNRSVFFFSKKVSSIFM